MPAANVLDIEEANAVVGGLKGDAAIYSTEEDKVAVQISVEEPVTGAVWSKDRVILSTGQGSIKLFENGAPVAQASEHAGAVTALSLHPSGELVASVGTDKSIVFYQTSTLERVSRAYTDACKLLTPALSLLMLTV